MFNNTQNEHFDDVVETETIIPQLSEEAKLILKEAVSDSSGTILFLRTLSGTTIQVNQHNLISSNERREVARWEAAIQQLVGNGLIIARGAKGEMFELTAHGYEIAEYI